MDTSRDICIKYGIDINKVLKYESLLNDWVKSINIIGKSTLEDFCQRHLLDSAQLSSFFHSNSKILDIGSGAGFPGIILVFLNHQVTFVEQNIKKCIFLKHVLHETATNGEVLNTDAYKITSQFEIVTARAFSSLNNLLRIQFNVSRETTKGIYPKGKNYQAELEEAQLYWTFNYHIKNSLSDPEGVILIIDELRPKLFSPE